MLLAFCALLQLGFTIGDDSRIAPFDITAIVANVAKASVLAATGGEEGGAGGEEGGGVAAGSKKYRAETDTVFLASRAGRGKILLIHGEDDDVVPVSGARDLLGGSVS